MRRGAVTVDSTLSGQMPKAIGGALAPSSITVLCIDLACSDEVTMPHSVVGPRLFERALGAGRAGRELCRLCAVAARAQRGAYDCHTTNMIRCSSPVTLHSSLFTPYSSLFLAHSLHHVRPHRGQRPTCGALPSRDAQLSVDCHRAGRVWGYSAPCPTRPIRRLCPARWRHKHCLRSPGLTERHQADSARLLRDSL